VQILLLNLDKFVVKLLANRRLWIRSVTWLAHEVSVLSSGRIHNPRNYIAQKAACSRFHHTCFIEDGPH